MKALSTNSQTQATNVLFTLEKIILELQQLMAEKTNYN